MRRAAPTAPSVPTHLKHSAPQGLRSGAALVLDTTHSLVLYSRNAEVAMPIASITKLMTALVIMDAQAAAG